MSRSIFSAACLLVVFLAPSARAQCPPGDTHWQNDLLPAVPSGPITFAVIPGLCPGEACGSVFTLAAGNMQTIDVVKVGFGNGSGLTKTATVSVEIYNGVTWSGNTPVMGTKVFDSFVSPGVTYTITSTSINEIDLSTHNINVGGAGATSFAVTFRMKTNTNGSCAAGYTTNFITDSSSTTSCNALAKKNLIFITGQGWKDPKFATVSGFPLCPLFYNGNWVIRACTFTPTVCQPNQGFGGPGNTALTVCGSALSSGNFSTLELAGATPGSTAILFAGLSSNPTFAPPVGGTIVPIPVLLSVGVPVAANGKFTTPVPGGGGPFSVYAQFVSPDASQPKGYEVSNAVKIDFLP